MEKRHKELVMFGVAIAVLALLAVMTLGKGKHAKPQAGAKRTEVQVATATTTSGAPAANGQASQPEEDKGPMLPIQGNVVGHPRERDPFVPTITVGMATRVTQPANATSNVSVPPVPPHVSGVPGVPNIMSIFGPNVTPANPNVGPTGVQAPTSSDSPIVLTGIVQGDPPVAVFRRADKRYFVRPGDEFAGYRVIEIAAQRVALARGSKPHSLPLGGKL